MDPSGSDKAPRDDQEYIEMEARVKTTASPFRNEMAERLIDIILLPRD